MRVLLVPNSYPPVLGGLQTVSHTLARHLASRGHSIRVITNRYPRGLPTDEMLDDILVSRWLFLHPTMRYLSRRRADLFLASFYYYPRGLFRFRQVIKGFQPDVVNVHFPDLQIPFVLWLRRRFPFRLVVSLHGDEIERWHQGKSHGNLMALQRILGKADAVTACSQYLLNRATELAPEVEEKGTVIHNGIEPSRFLDRTKYNHPRPYVLAYGRLTRAKGFDLLLEAWALALESLKDVDLIVAGEGEEREHIHQQIHRLGLTASVYLYGQATSEEVVQLLNGCRLVVVPSRHESFGIVALEALAAGKPLIATAVGGLVELLESTSACLVEPTARGIRDGLQNWARHPSTSSQDTKLLTEHSWHNVLSRYESILMGQARNAGDH